MCRIHRVWCLAALALACDDGGGGEAAAPDAGRRRLDAGAPRPTWAVETVDQTDVARPASLALGPDGALAVAYYQAARADGPCDEIGAQPPERQRWPLRFARRGADAWTIETVDIPLGLGPPTAPSLAFGPDGAPAIAAQVGPASVDLHYCGANDVGLHTRDAAGAWTTETAVRESNDAATGAPASDFGTVVGPWPALAFDADGAPAIAYKDVHGGGLQRDDLRRADLELARRAGGAWRATAVDFGEGAGDYNALLFDAAGRPIIVYHLPVEAVAESRHGLWVARLADDGSTWQRVRIHAGRTVARPSAMRHPDTGELVVAFYHGGERRPYLAWLRDPAAFESLEAGWELEPVGEGGFDEGQHPSVAVDPGGRLALVWYRCVRAAGGAGDCDPNDDAAIFAWRDGDTWRTETIDAGQGGNCGLNPGLVFADDGAAWVTYTCSVRQGDTFVFELRAARRAALR